MIHWTGDNWIVIKTFVNLSQLFTDAFVEISNQQQIMVESTILHVHKIIFNCFSFFRHFHVNTALYSQRFIYCFRVNWWYCIFSFLLFCFVFLFFCLVCECSFTRTGKKLCDQFRVFKIYPAKCIIINYNINIFFLDIEFNSNYWIKVSL